MGNPSKEGVQSEEANQEKDARDIHMGEERRRKFTPKSSMSFNLDLLFQVCTSLFLTCHPRIKAKEIDKLINLVLIIKEESLVLQEIRDRRQWLQLRQSVGITQKP